LFDTAYLSFPGALAPVIDLVKSLAAAAAPRAARA
jgi:hypothetical protein